MDPGIATAGLAVVAAAGGRPSLVWSHTVRTPAGLEEAGRLRMVYGAVRDAIGDHQPAALAVERLMWGRNVGSAMSVARATGVILLAADAVAVAFCHLTQSPLRRLHKEAARADVRQALAKVTPLAVAGRRRLPRWDS